MHKAPQIIGILNVTPDSYYDGGRFTNVPAAIARAKELLVEGADWIEVGGESTGPNSHDIPVEEELRRVLPVIKALHAELPQARLAVDTHTAEIAKAALAEGVGMVNDVTAGRADPALFTTVSASDALLVLMFSKDPTPRTTVAMTPYNDVLASVSAFLADRRDAAVSAGVRADRIVLDPGMGHFVSSDPRWSLELLARLSELTVLGCPLYVSPSRKSFLAGSENLKTADRLPGTVAASAVAVLHGATYVRTHDVLEVRRGCEVAAGIAALIPDRGLYDEVHEHQAQEDHEKTHRHARQE